MQNLYQPHIEKNEATKREEMEVAIRAVLSDGVWEEIPKTAKTYSSLIRLVLRLYLTIKIIKNFEQYNFHEKKEIDGKPSEHAVAPWSQFLAGKIRVRDP